MRLTAPCVLAGVAWLACAGAGADGGQNAAGAPRQGATQAHMVSNLTPFAGSEANARNLVAGLREGRAVTLTAAGPNGGPGSATTFTPPTPPMGHGSAYISLALARQQLASHGVTRPSPAEIEAALMGGRIVASGPAAGPVQLPGVLRMRARGVAWSRIAAAMRVKLTAVMDDARRAALAGAGRGATTAGASNERGPG